jgi:hypothetical protein
MSGYVKGILAIYEWVCKGYASYIGEYHCIGMMTCNEGYKLCEYTATVKHAAISRVCDMPLE